MIRERVLLILFGVFMGAKWLKADAYANHE
jgi:hypothetical protein